MNFSNDYVTPDEILSNVIRIAQDEAFVLGSYGFYVNQMQYALQELAFDTFFDVQIKEIDITDNLRMPLPGGAFNVREIFVYNGDLCNISSPMKVWNKRNYWTGGKGYVARDRGDVNNDPFYENRVGGKFDMPFSQIQQFQQCRTSVDNLLFYNIQGGTIMLSPRCRSWQKLFIVYNGYGADANNVPCIPTYLQEAVKLWVSDIALSLRLAQATTPFELQKWNLILNNTLVKLNGRTNRQFDGAWYEAEKRVKSMDTNARQDLKEYLTRLVK